MRRLLWLVGALAVTNVAVAREPFSVPFKPLKPDVVVTEILWQAENVVDLKQTLQIASEPARYHEIGTMRPITGPHPTMAQVWVFSALFGIGHYAVTQALTNAGYDTAARVWAYTSLGLKTVNMQSNMRIGLKP
jgi:hypothetical protein